MLKANQKDMPPIQNMMFKVSVKLHSSVAFWVAIVPHPGRICLQNWGFKKKRHWTMDVKSTSSTRYNQEDREKSFQLLFEDLHTNCCILKNEICISNLRIYVLKLQTTGSFYRVGWSESHINNFLKKNQLIMKWNIAFFPSNFLARNLEIFSNSRDRTNTFPMPLLNSAIIFVLNIC